jgi:hypothetical protein
MRERQVGKDLLQPDLAEQHTNRDEEQEQQEHVDEIGRHDPSRPPSPE